MPATLDSRTHDRNTMEDDPLMQSFASALEEEAKKLNPEIQEQPITKESDERQTDDGKASEQKGDDSQKEQASSKAEEEEYGKRLLDELVNSRQPKEETVEEEDQPEATEGTTEKPVGTTEETPASNKDDEDDEEESNPHNSKYYEIRLKRAKQKARKQAEAEYEAKMAEIKAQYEQQIEEAKKQTAPDQDMLNEYLMYKRRYDAENDPEIAKKFQSRIEANEKATKAILARYYAPEKVESIKSVAEFAKYNPDAWQEALDKIAEISPLDAKTLDHKVVEAVAAHEEKKVEIENASKQAKEYFTNLEETQKKSIAERQKQQQETVEKVNTYKTQVFGMEPFQIKDPAKANTPEESKRLEVHNRTAKMMRQQFEKMLTANTLEEEIDIRAAAAMAFRFKTEMEEAKQEAETWRKKYEERAKAGQVNATRTQSRASSMPQSKPSEPKTMEELFAQAARNHLGA